MAQHIREQVRQTEVVGEYDVLVCGAGPAGIGAALSAAWSGARTALIEKNGCLGGVWTAGLLSWVIDAANKPGVLEIIIRGLEQRHVYTPSESRDFSYDTETMKLILDKLIGNAGIHIRLYSSIVAVARQGDRKITHVITESKAGRQAWAARVFVDTTGDGDVAAMSGCGYDVGSPQTGETQPMSLIALLAGISEQQVVSFAGGGDREAKRRFLQEMNRAGITPSYDRPTLYRIRPALFALMANQERGAGYDDVEGQTRASMHARSELHHIIDTLKSRGGIWSDVHIVATADQIGIREARRIHGLYQITQQDLLDGTRHEDAICRVNYGIDIHALYQQAEKTVRKIENKPTLPYDIPLRALIARDKDNLLLAGRCISGDRIAHSSYRVTGDAVATGEAAGCCAAQAARLNIPVNAVPREDFLHQLCIFRQQAVSGEVMTR
ncbi:MAG: FAD-dependent oxidoreductase [Chitinivibrionales bacterium]